MSLHDQIMDHGYFQDRLSGYLDAELTPEEMRALAEHLETCAECRRRLEELRHFDRFVEEQRDLGDSDYWEQSAQKIEARLDEASQKVTDIRPETRRSSGLWWKISAVAASVIIVGYIGLYRDEILKGTADRLPAPETTRIAPEISQTAPPDTIAYHDEIAVAEEPAAEAAKPSATNEIPRPAPTAVPPPLSIKSEEQQAPVQGKPARQLAATAEQEALPPPPPPPGVKDQPEPTPTTDRVRKAAPVGAALDEGKTAATDKAAVVSDRAKQVAPAESDQDLSKSIAIPAVEGEVGLVKADTASLAYWRGVRDSLMGPEEGQSATKLDGVVGRPSRKLPSNSYVNTGRISVAQSEVAQRSADPLLEAWFEICRISPDTAEVAKGRHLLDSIAADSTAPSCELAKDYVKKLDAR